MRDAVNSGTEYGGTELRFPLWCVDRLRMATDGNGVTALVCAYGCPLDCRYCINPESHAEGEKFQYVTVEQLFAKVRQDGLYYSATGGGITFGGGEPLLHADFIGEFRKRIPSDWHIYAETSLAVPEKNVLKAADVVDRFIVDVKDTDPSIYGSYTKRPDLYGLMLSNLKLLLERAGPSRITVRLPLIEGYNTEENVEASVKLLSELGITDFDRFTYRIKNKKKQEK